MDFTLTKYSELLHVFSMNGYAFRRCCEYLKAFQEYEREAVNKVACCYNERLAGKVTVPYVPDGLTSREAQYTIQLEDRSQRDKVQQALKQQGIPAMVYYPKALHEQTAFHAIFTLSSVEGGTPYGACPNTDELCNTVLSLPMHPHMTVEEVDCVCDALTRNLL